MSLFYTFIIFIISWSNNNRIKKTPNAAGCFENELSDEHTTTGRTLQNKTPCWILVTYFTGGAGGSVPCFTCSRTNRSATTHISVFSHTTKFILLHTTAFILCYKTNIKKNRNLQVSLCLWSQYKKQHFFFFFFRRRIKLHDEMFPLSCSSPPPLI